MWAERFFKAYFNPRSPTMHVLCFKAPSQDWGSLQKALQGSVAAWVERWLPHGRFGSVHEALAGLRKEHVKGLSSRTQVWRVLGLLISSGGERSLTLFLYLQMKLITCSNSEIIAAHDNLEVETSTEVKVVICRACPWAVLRSWLLF